MAPVGFTHDTSSTINAIREILDNYNWGFPVIRELLQNADDAGATTLDIGWMAAPRGFANPLLTGPALFVLNNGPFSDSNEEAIRRISGSDKGGQDGAIGKFGRGLKSIFHLCEGFVYASSAVRGDQGVRWPLDPQRTELLTPWAGSEYHSEWGAFGDSERDAVGSALDPFLPAGQQWFSLWVPLRRKSACTGCKVAQIRENTFPGDEGGPPAFLLDEVSGGCIETMHSLPLLSSLRSVRYWLPGSDGRLEPHEVRFSDGSTRREFKAEQTAAGERRFGGELHTDRGGGIYSGREVLLPSEGKFEELKDSSDWPVRDVIKGGKQKGEPHAAAVFLGVPATGTGTLRVADAVFLPVGPRPSPLDCPGRWDIDLLLHGYSFVNSNRTDIERGAGTADAKQQLRAEWNRALRSCGVLPSVLPALDEFVTAASMALGEVEAVTDAIAAWFRGHANDALDIRRDQQWLPCIEQSGAVVYRLIPAGQPFYELPALPTDKDLPFGVFPVLAELAGEVPVTFKGMARLAGSPAPWPAQPFMELVDSVPAADVFGSEPKLAYLAAFLGANPAPLDRTHALLVGKLQGALKSVGLARLKESPAFRRTLGQVDRRLLLPFDDVSLPPNTGRAVNDATAYFASVATAVLTLPWSLLRTVFQGAQTDPDLSEADARALLEALANEPDALRSDTFGQIRTRLADTFFRMEGSAGTVARTEFGDNPLFRAWVAGVGDTTVPWNAIKLAYSTHRLLRHNSTVRPDPAPALAEAAGGASGVIVVLDYVQSAGDDIPRCTLDACAEILLRTPHPAPGEQRLAFLRKLLESPTPSSVVKQATRYLLHGNTNAIGDDDLLLFGEMHGDVWTKLAYQALGDERWRLVDGRLAAEIQERRYGEFGLKRISATSVAERIRRHGPDLMECGDDALTEADRLRVVRELHDSELLRALPMHRDTAGTFGPIDSHTYVASGFALPADLGHQVRLLSPMGPELEAKLQLTTWTPVAAVREALAHDGVGGLASIILDCLAAPGMPELDEETKSQLRGKPWLPLTAGGFAKPEDVVHIDGLEEHISRIAAKCGGAYYDVGMVAPAVRNHPGFSRLRGVIQTGEQALKTLPLMIEEAGLEAYRIGPVELTADRISAFVQTFEGAPMGVMEAASLLGAVLQKGFAPSTVAAQLTTPLRGEISRERFAAILNYLAARHGATGREHQQAALDWHGRYLAAAHDAGFRTELLNDIQLLNQLGKWRTPADLCHDYPNVSPASLVDVRQAAVLGIGRGERADAAETEPSTRTESPSGGEAGRVLRDYFVRWQNYCPPEAIGGFLAFLGDEPDVRQLAQRYLGQRDIELVRGMVTWKPLPGFVGGGGEDIADVMAQQHFVVEVVPPGEPQQVVNLLGGVISVPLAESLTSLIQNRLFHSYVGPGRRNLLRLYDVDPSSHDVPTLSALLRASTFSVIADIYRQEAYRDHGPSELDRFWKDLEDSHLVDLRTAQEVILHHLLSSAKLLKIGHAPALRELIRLEEGGVRGAIEGEKLTDDRKRERALREAEQKRREARTSLEDLLRSGDRETAEALLAGVRHRIRDESQYRPTSVPFELFQNADDAAVERDELAGTVTGRSYRFVVAAEGNLLSFGHQGRGINDFRTSGGALERFRERDFHRDLEKMLMLGASDKGITDPGQVTGKFGLGFKSVFLLSQKPRIASGPLAVEVVAGTFPVAVTGEEYEQLVAEQGQLGVPGGTVFELPVEAGRESDASDAMEAFQRHAPLLAAFARRTNHITWRRGGAEELLEWAPRAVGAASGCQVGALPGAVSRDLPAHALRLVAGNGALLLGLDARGVTRLPDWVPGVWVTAPTEEAQAAGFALNGRFELHAGRSELASTAREANNAIAGTLGVALGETLAGMVRATASWEDFSRDLGLGADAEPYAFWESLLEVLANVRKPGEGFDILRAALWGDTSKGAARLYGSFAVLPSGLRGEHRLLLQARNVQHRVAGLLAEEPFFSVVMAIEPVRENAPAGTVIAQSVVDMIPLGGLVSGNGLDLAQALQWVFQSANNVVDPELASSLGLLFDADHLDQRAGNKNQSEAALLRNLLDDLRFQASDGTPRRSRELVAGHAAAKGIVDDDEVARATFAPGSATLATAYDAAGVRFFKLCRVEMSANTATLLEWAKQAEGEQLDGFIEYTQRGRLRADVQDAVRDDPSWLVEKGAAERIEELVEDARDMHFAQASLGLAPRRSESAVRWQPESEPTAPPLTPDEVQDGLHRFVAWWQRSGGRVIRDYEHALFPADDSPLQGWTREELADKRDLDVRMLWMQLFVLAAAHTLGRQRPEQHREFLRRFERDGWLELFASSHTEWETDSLVKQLRGYVIDLVDDEQYAHWMRLFVPLFQVSHYLDDYIELFLDVDRDLKGDTSLDQFLNPARNPAYQGGGLRPAGIRAALGLGAHFVLREMARAGLIHTSGALQHCVVPRQRVLQLIAALGGAVGNGGWDRSREIVQFLKGHLGDDWHFDKAFDIALYELARDVEKQREFFGQPLVTAENEQ